MTEWQLVQRSGSTRDHQGEQTPIGTSVMMLPSVPIPSKRLLHTDYNVGWICALSIEMTAAQVMLDEVHISLENPPGDDNVYVLGSIFGHNVVLACLPSGVYGTTSATTVGIAMSTTFPNATKIPVLVGIGGGVPRTLDNEWPDIRLGDVVVSTPTSEHPAVVQYDYGKTVKNGVSVSKGSLNKPARILLNAISALRSQHEITPNNISEHISEALQRHGLAGFAYPGSELDDLYGTECDHSLADGSDFCLICEPEAVILRKPRPDSSPRIHYGSIASGNQVIKHGRTRDRIARQGRILCFEMEAAGLMDLLSPLVIRGICDYCDSRKEKRFQRYSALTAAAYAKELLSLIPIQKSTIEIEPRYQRTEKDNATLAKIMLSDPRLDKKRIEATKGGLLRDSYRWVLSNQEFKAWRRDKDLLWVRGDPGKGKTMLLCGIIDELQKTSLQKTLAYFFCQATNQAINTGTAVLRGLIYILADENPVLISHISKRLDKSNNAFDTNSWYMLSQILEDMFAHMKDTRIIIDALDECIEQREDLLRFITLNRDKATFLVSSRNWPEIEDVLRRAPLLSLELNAASVSQAIEYYIRFKVNELTIAKDFDEDMKNTVFAYLQQYANGTFLWVALVCMNLTKVRKRHVSAKLRQFPSDLNDVYGRMWHMVEDNDDTELMQRILALCNLAVRPLNLKELETVLEIPEDLAASLEEIVQDCGSFLTIKEDVIEFVHQSAKEYVDKKNCIASKPLHKEIFSRSMAALFRVLQRDLYGLKDPATSISEVEQLEPGSDPLAGIQYACVNWSHHLIEYGDLPSSEQTLLRRFLKSFYLPWLEAMSLLRSMTAAVIAMHDIESLVGQILSEDDYYVNEAYDTTLRALFYDARRFVQYFRDIVETFPLQVYYSGLLFSPEHSMVRKVYSAEALRSIQIARYLSTEWHPVLTKLNLRPDTKGVSVTAFSFSHDSKQIFVGYKDGLMQIWDLKSMVLMHSTSITGTFGKVNDYCIRSAFLPHTQKVLCQHRSAIATIWDLATACKSDLGIVEIVTISKHGIVALKESSNSIQFLNALGTQYQGETRLKLDMYNQPYRLGPHSDTPLVFAADDNIIAVRTAINTVEIWSIENLQIQGSISTDNCLHHAMALSTQYLCICEFDKVKSRIFTDNPTRDMAKLNVYDIRNGSLISLYSLGITDFLDDPQLEIVQDSRYIIFSHRRSYIYDIAAGSCIWKSSGYQYCWLSSNLRYNVSLRGIRGPESHLTLQESFTQPSAIAMKDAPDTLLSRISSDCRRILLYSPSRPRNDRVIEIDSDITRYHNDAPIYLQFSSDLMLLMVENLNESSCQISRLLPDSLETILTLKGIMKSRPGNGDIYPNLAFAPNSLYVAVIKRGRQVVIYHLESGEETLSITCKMSIIRMEWSQDSSKIVLSGRKGFILIDIHSKEECLRSHYAIWMGFSEDETTVMMWYPDRPQPLINPMSPTAVSPYQEPFCKQEIPDDETEYEQVSGSEHFKAWEPYPTSIWLDSNLKPADDDLEDDEPEDESKRQLPPLGNCKVQAGVWIEWNIVGRYGRRLPKFHPELFLANFCFNSRFLAMVEAPWRIDISRPLTMRIWDRLSGKQCSFSNWIDSSLRFMKFQSNILHTNRGVMTIEADRIRLGSQNDYFFDGQWLWLDNKRTVRAPNGYGQTDYRNKTFAIEREGGGVLVLRSS